MHYLKPNESFNAKGLLDRLKENLPENYQTDWKSSSSISDPHFATEIIISNTFSTGLDGKEDFRKVLAAIRKNGSQFFIHFEPGITDQEVEILYSALSVQHFQGIY